MPENVVDAMTKILTTLESHTGIFNLEHDESRGEHAWLARLDYDLEDGTSAVSFGLGGSALEAVSEVAKDLH